MLEAWQWQVLQQEICGIVEGAVSRALELYREYEERKAWDEYAAAVLSHPHSSSMDALGKANELLELRRQRFFEGKP